jgi:hypothetical protein
VVERYHRNVKYECLLIHRPQTEEEVREVNATYVQHYNTERPSQALPCGNRPPTVAFPTLPKLPAIPPFVDPDAWLDQLDGLQTVRKVRANGTIRLDDVPYYIKGTLAGQYVNVRLNATQQWIEVEHQGRLLKQLPIKGLKRTALPYATFVEVMAQEALGSVSQAAAPPTSEPDTSRVTGGMWRRRENEGRISLSFRPEVVGIASRSLSGLTRGEDPFCSLA